MVEPVDYITGAVSANYLCPYLVVEIDHPEVFMDLQHLDPFYQVTEMAPGLPKMSPSPHSCVVRVWTQPGMPCDVSGCLGTQAMTDTTHGYSAVVGFVGRKGRMHSLLLWMGAPAPPML